MKRLFEYLKKPELFALSNHKFWDDEHISKKMLDAHLNPNWDAATRNHTFVEHSVNWINKSFPNNDFPQVLDLGCGPGIYSNLLNKKGYKVTGIDYSKRSIEYAKAHNQHNLYLYINYLNINYENEFDLILLIYCDYGALTDDERRKMLSIVHKALKKGGFFIFDVNTPNLYHNTVETNNWYVNEGSGFWKNETHIVFEANYFYKDNIYLNQFVVVDNEYNIDVYRIWDKVYTKTTILEDIEPYDFSEITYFADVSGSNYSDESNTMCIVLKK